MFQRLESRTLFSTPTLSTANVAVTESSGATATITVKLSKKRTGEVKVTFTTKSGAALSGTNFVAHRGTIVIPQGDTTGSVSIPIIDDISLTTDKAFYVDFTGATHAILPSPSLFSRVTIEPGTVTPVDISDNLAESSGGTQLSIGGSILAASFIAPGTSTLTSVTIPLEQTSTGAVTAYIYSDNGSQPGAAVGTLTSPTSFSETGLADATFTSAKGVSLVAGETYWVVLSSTGDFNWSFTTAGEGNGSGFSGLWAESSNGGGAWFTNSSSPLQMSVSVT